VSLIKRNERRVWLDLDELYPPPLEHPNTVFKSWSIAARALGAGLSYVEIMGVSSAAFRIQVGANLCPSSPHPHLGFDCGAVAQHAFGFEFRGRSCPQDDEDAVQEIRGMIRASIDEGRPVLLEEEETGLAVGYTLPDLAILARHPYSGQGDEPAPLEHWPWMFAFPEGMPHEASREALWASLSAAVESASSDEEHGDGYLTGLAGYRRWIGDLLDDALLNREDVEAGAVVLGNAHIYYCLVDARRCATEYLRSLASRLPPDVGTRLAEAASTYGDITDALTAGWNTFPWPQQLESASAWSRERRREQAALLEGVADLERRAVTQIQSILVART
jgi:hypothetical protein